VTRVAVSRWRSARVVASKIQTLRVIAIEVAPFLNFQRELALIGREAPDQPAPFSSPDSRSTLHGATGQNVQHLPNGLLTTR
jgi:hypothetical protein